MANSIRHNFFFSHPPAVVWDYLTKPELIAQWLMQNDFQPIVGYDFQFRHTPLPQLGFDGHVFCKVLEVVPFKKLSYSWKGGPAPGEITLDSIVTWTLREKGDGTELSLVHDGFTSKIPVAGFEAMNKGWQMNVEKIDTLIKAATHGTPSA